MKRTQVNDGHTIIGMFTNLPCHVCKHSRFVKWMRLPIGVRRKAHCRSRKRNSRNWASAPSDAALNVACVSFRIVALADWVPNQTNKWPQEASPELAPDECFHAEPISASSSLVRNLP
jgi:hypothetical protein